MTQSFLFASFVVVFLSPLWSATPFLSIVGVEPRFEGVMAYGIFFGLALLAGGMVRAGREQGLLHVILGSNTGVVFYGLLQLVGMDPFNGWWEADLFLGRVFSTVGQPNMLAQFLLLTAPFAVLTAWRGWGASMAGIVMWGNLLVLLATGSRAGILGAVVGGLCVWVCVTLSSSKGAHRSCNVSCFDGLGMTHFVVPFLVLIIVSLPFAFQRFSILGEWDRSIGGRIAIWSDAVSMIYARPFGWGLETTGLVFPRFQHAPLTAYESLTASVDRAHSKPLDLLLTVGPLGLLAYYGFLTMLIARCLCAWRRHRDGLAFAGAVSLLGVSVSLFFGFEGIVVHAFFWLICGMLVGLPLPAPVRRSLGAGGGKGRGEGLPKTAASHPCHLPIGEGIAVLLSVLCVSIFFFTVLSLSSRFAAARAERSFQQGDLTAAVQEYARSVRQAPWDRVLLVRFLETTLLAREQAENRETEHTLDAAFEKRFRLLRWLTSGSDPLIPSLQAWQAALQGKKKEALGFLDEAKHLASFSIPRLRIAGKVAQLLGDKTMENALRTELENMLPPWWNDGSDPRSRILRKEHPWLTDMVRSSMP